MNLRVRISIGVFAIAAAASLAWTAAAQQPRPTTPRATQQQPPAADAPQPARGGGANRRGGLSPLPKVTSARLYVIDCGTIIYARPEEYGLTREEMRYTNMSVSCYLVIHPKGVLLFDTGLSDEIVGRPIYENPVGQYSLLKLTTLKGELASIGVAPSDVTYLAFSHGHLDHVANANDYAGSTWLTPSAEKAAMFTSNAQRTNYYYQYSALAQAKTVEYEGDHDVFGDGAVVLKATPGHTPGHQSLYVKLAKAGGVVLSGDLWHYPEERSLNRMPEREKTTLVPASRAAMEVFLRQTNSQLWIGHDMGAFKDLTKSPGWYE